MFDQVQKLRRIAGELEAWSARSSAAEDLREVYGVGLVHGTNPDYLDILISSLKRLPPQLVIDCKISDLGFEDMGKSEEYFPNHGK